jgi:hypothetical protein
MSFCASKSPNQIIYCLINDSRLSSTYRISVRKMTGHRQSIIQGIFFPISLFSRSFCISINSVSHLQALTHPDFMALIRSVYGSLLNCVEGLQVENKIFIEVLDALQFVTIRYDTYGFANYFSCKISNPNC